VNFLQLLYRVGREIVPRYRVSISSCFRNKGPERYWHHDLDLSRSRDVISDVIIRSAIGHFLLVGSWYRTVFEIFASKYECAQTDGRTDRNASKTVYPPVSLRLLGGYNNTILASSSCRFCYILLYSHTIPF